METLKNFLVGLFILAASLIIAGAIFLTWPLIIGISSVILSIIIIILYIILIFYIVVLVGYLATRLLSRKK